jgi:hypothetical protein
MKRTSPIQGEIVSGVAMKGFVPLQASDQFIVTLERGIYRD